MIFIKKVFFLSLVGIAAFSVEAGAGGYTATLKFVFGRLIPGVNAVLWLDTAISVGNVLGDPVVHAIGNPDAQECLHTTQLLKGVEGPIDKSVQVALRGLEQNMRKQIALLKKHPPPKPGEMPPPPTLGRAAIATNYEWRQCLEVMNKEFVRISKLQLREPREKTEERTEQSTEESHEEDKHEL